MAQPDLSALIIAGLPPAPDSKPTGSASPAAQQTGPDLSAMIIAGLPEAARERSEPGNVADFVATYKPLAQRVGKSIGVAPEALLGQWGLETGWGKSVIPGTNNLGNIKDPTGAGTQAVDNQTGSRDAYRKYASVEQFGDDFAGLIGRRYKSAQGSGADLDRYFTALKSGGYAEDADYVKKGTAAAAMAKAAMRGSAQAPAGDAYTDMRPTPAPKRTAFEAINDTVIDAANATAGLVKAGIDLFAPDSAASRFIDNEIIKDGQAKQSEYKQYLRQKLAAELKEVGVNDGSTSGQVAAEFRKAGTQLAHSLTEDPLGTVGEIFGNVGPFAILGRGMQAAKLSKGVATAISSGVAGGLSAGEVRGNIWEKISSSKDADLMASSPAYAELRKNGMTEAQAKSELGANFSRNFPELAFIGLIGALSGKYGAEGMMAGVAPKYRGGRLGSAAVGGIDEGLLQGGAEQVASNYGVQRAIPSQSLLEDVGPNIVMEGLPGVAMGAMHSGPAAPPALSPALQAVAANAQQPNTPLSKAATAGGIATATAPQQAPVDPAQRLAELEAVGQQGGVFTPEQQQEYEALKGARDATPGAVPDDIGAKATAVRDQIRQNRGVLDALRAEGSPFNPQSFLKDLSIATSKSAQPAMREQALSRVEMALEWAGTNPAPTVETNLDELPGMVAGEERAGTKTTPAQRREGVDRDAALIAERDGTPARKPGEGARSEADRREQAAIDIESSPKADTAALDRALSLREQAAALRRQADKMDAEAPKAKPGAMTEKDRQSIDEQRQVNLEKRLGAPAKEAPAPAPAAPRATATDQARLEAAALAGKDAQRRAEDNPRQVVIDRALRNVEERGGVASSAEARIFQEAKLGKPYDRIDESLAPQPDLALPSAAPAPSPAKSKGGIELPAGGQRRTDGGQRLEGVRSSVEPTKADKLIAGTEPGAAPAREPGLDFERDIDTSKLSLEPKKSTERAADSLDDKPNINEPAFVRKRKAQIAAVAAQGYETVERRDGVFYLRNSRTANEVKLSGRADAALARQAIKQMVDERAHTAAPSPLNDRPEPTDNQIHNKDGRSNYKKSDRIPLNGVTVRIENPVGSIRRARPTAPVQWQTKMKHHYGEIEGTKGADGDPVDVFVGPNPASPKIWVIDQVDEKGKFDEAKVMFGFDSESAARAGYLSNFSSGWKGLGKITEMTQDEFRAWAKDQGATMAPAAESAKPDTDAKSATTDAEKASTETFTVRIDGKDVRFERRDIEALGENESPERDGKATRISKRSAALIKAMAQALGKKVVFFSDVDGVRPGDGFVRPNEPDTIYINEVSTINPLAVMGHEFLHTLRLTNSAAWDAIAAVVKGRVKSPAGFRRDYYGADEAAKRGNAALSEEQGGELEELVSDLGGNLMSDPKFWGEVFDKIRAENGRDAKGIIARLLATLQTMVDKIAAVVKGPKFRADNFVNDLDAIRAAYRDGLASYLQKNGESKAGMQAEILKSELRIERGRLDGVPAVHYSQQPRKELSSDAFGTGLRGSGRDSYLQAEDKRRRQRIYFYFDKGTGIRPEAGVGAYPHKATLNNVYDSNADPLKLRGGSQAAFETKLLDAGFDGYLDRMEGTQPGQIIMLGKRSIPVEPIQRSDVPNAPQIEVADSPISKGLMSKEMNAIEVSNIPGARLRAGTLTVPQASRDAANAEMARIGSSIRFSAERLATAEDEIEAVRKKYEGTDQWMKAPDGTATKLTERQWLHVRTPSFKAWFGPAIEAAAARSLISDRLGGGQAAKVLDRMVGAVGQSQILDSVVASIPVDVVNNLGGQQRATEVLLHDPAVLVDVAAARKALPDVVDSFSGFMEASNRVVAVARAELAQANAAASNTEGAAALHALQNNLVFAARRLAGDGRNEGGDARGLVDYPVLHGLALAGVGAKPATIPGLTGGGVELDAAAVTRQLHAEDYKLAWPKVEAAASHSAAVSKNGEPMVVYHGTDTGGFSVFKRPGGKKRGDLGIFTSDDRDVARTYVHRNNPRTFVRAVIDEFADDQEPTKIPGVYALFINIRNPSESDFEGANWEGSRDDQFMVVDEDGGPIYADDGTKYFHNEEDALALVMQKGGNIEPAEEHYETTDGVVRDARRSGSDGAIIRQVVDSGSGGDYFSPSDLFVAFEPNQLKSADFNDGTYSVDEDDIRRSAPRELKRVHDFEVSTRTPYAKETKGFKPEDAKANLLISDFSAGLGQAKWLNAVTELVETYPNYRPSPGAGTPERKLERMVRQMVDNLVWLHDQVPADTRARSKLWYDGARAIVDRWVKKYGITDAQAAGILAVLSPQKDWFMNVSLANRVADILSERQYFRWSKEMDETSGRIFGKDTYAEDISAIRGEKLQDIDDPYLRAMWVRVYDQAHNPASFYIVSPEGDFIAEARTKNGELGRVAWGGNSTIAKAVSIFEDGSFENISAALGRKHKVRNFYNNILVPNSPNGHVTIDTHAVAAALLRPLSGNSIEVMHNFGGPKSAHAGLEGSYALYEEAYRRAAAERGILPREMQSITWEAIRGLYVPTFKAQKKNVDAIDAVWDRYAKGRLSYENARQQVVELGGGIDPPGWEGRDPGAYVEDEPAADDGDLSEDGVPGRRARADGRGARAGAGAAARRSASRDRGGLDQGRGAAQGARAQDGAGRLTPLPGYAHGHVQGSGPDPRLVEVAERYAAANGIKLRRQAEYVQVDEARAKRIAQAYEAMPHAPRDPKVKEAYDDLIRQTRAQYDALVGAGYEFTFFDGATDPYKGNPWAAMRDLRANKKMAVYGTYDGYGTEGVTQGAVDDNPMLADTGLRWKDQAGVEHPVVANDLFRAVHDAFGHGLEGAGFRAQGEENAWQAHVRLFTGPAVGAITTETRGQNSWLNYGPYGEKNRNAGLGDTVFADQKTGLMPEWAWQEGRAADENSGAATVDPAIVAILEGLERKGLPRQRAEDALAARPDADKIRAAMDNFIDTLADLEEAGAIDINCK